MVVHGLGVNERYLPLWRTLAAFTDFGFLALKSIIEFWAPAVQTSIRQFRGMIPQQALDFAH